jgi:endonuclease/exonuclease/phosphatase family metal-dependent hydrolase
MMIKKYLLWVYVLLSYTSLQAQAIKVMTYNIHHGTDRHEVNTLKEIGWFIKSTGADLVGLQEVDSMCSRSGKEDQMKTLAEITGMHYAFVRHFAYDGGAYGLGILSKFPVANIKNDRISALGKDGEKKTLALLSADVAVSRKRKILFSTVHFALDQPTRITQSDEVLGYLKSELPVIITGDLNAEPVQKEILKLEQSYASIDGAGQKSLTFPDHGAVKKIDYVFVKKTVLKRTVNSLVLPEVHLSDHLPLLVEVVVGKK